MSHKVTQIFDSVAGDYDAVLPFFSSLARSIAAELELRPGMHVLDLGCGTGAITAEALAHSCRVTAVDAAPRMIEQLRANHPLVDAHVMDAHRLTFKDAAFDIVIAAFAIHLLDAPAVAAREVRRALVPGGRFALSVPGPPVDTTVPPDVTIQLFDEFAQYLPSGGSMGHPLDAQELLAGSGFVDITRTPVEVRLHVPDGPTLWRWLHTHGTKAFLDDLPTDRRIEFRGKLLDGVGPDGVMLGRTALLFTGSLPA